MAKAAHDGYEELKVAKQKKLREMDVIELTENLCDDEKAQGDWISRIDIQEKGD